MKPQCIVNLENVDIIRGFARRNEEIDYAPNHDPYLDSVYQRHFKFREVNPNRAALD